MVKEMVSNELKDGLPVLKLENVQKAYGDKQAVNGVSLEVKKGDVYGFLGPNGAGKTTTIKLILGLLYLDNGNIIVNGYNIKDDFKLAIEKVGAVVETPRFYEYLTGIENLRQIANLHSNIPQTRIDEVIEIVGLKHRINEKVSKYSLGMKQRLGIARALLNNPSLIILDEPTNGLDPQGMKEIRELILELADKNKITFFISTHLLNEVEQICNKVAILKEGELVTSGRVDSLLDKNVEELEVVTSDSKKAEELLKKKDYITIINKNDKGFQLEINRGKSADLNNLLVSNNVKVDYLIPKNQSLEDYFIEITQEGGSQIV